MTGNHVPVLEVFSVIRQPDIDGMKQVLDGDESLLDKAEFVPKSLLLCFCYKPVDGFFFDPQFGCVFGKHVSCSLFEAGQERSRNRDRRGTCKGLYKYSSFHGGLSLEFMEFVMVFSFIVFL